MNPLASQRDLKLGVPIATDLVDLQGRLLLRKGSIIESDAVIASLIEGGARLLRTAPPAQANSFHLYVRKLESSPFEIIRYLESDLKRLLTAEVSVANFDATIRSMATALIEATERDEDAALAAILLHSGTGYAINHHIHAGIIATILAASFGHTPRDRLSTVCAALTMNLAMVEYQEWLNDKKGQLSDDERTIVRTHPSVGVEILRSSGVTDPLWLRVVAEHHETVDGTGYPLGSNGDSIHELSQCLHLADLFTARITSRGWCEQSQANATLAEMLKDATTNKLHSKYVLHLIRVLGAFPPGCVVALRNDECGIVLRRGTTATTPLVCSLENRGLKLGSPVRRDTSIEKFAVERLLPFSSITLPPRIESLWGRDLLHQRPNPK
ncbi:MAG: HD domain-containing protein [Fibrobacteria bacterium]|nr:HD domain-containing protein [Fibrobacteria bacterium]